MILSFYYSVWFCVAVLLRCFAFRHLITMFYLRMGDSNRKNIFDKTETTNHIMIVNMLQSWSHTYFILYIIIKFIGFESIYYTINLGVFPSFMIFNDLIFMFMLIYC